MPLHRTAQWNRLPATIRVTNLCEEEESGINFDCKRARRFSKSNIKVKLCVNKRSEGGKCAVEYYDAFSSFAPNMLASQPATLEQCSAAKLGPLFALCQRLAGLRARRLFVSPIQIDIHPDPHNWPWRGRLAWKVAARFRGAASPSWGARAWSGTKKRSLNSTATLKCRLGRPKSADASCSIMRADLLSSPRPRTRARTSTPRRLDTSTPMPYPLLPPSFSTQSPGPRMSIGLVPMIYLPLLAVLAAHRSNLSGARAPENVTVALPAPDEQSGVFVATRSPVGASGWRESGGQIMQISTSPLVPCAICSPARDRIRARTAGPN